MSDVPVDIVGIPFCRLGLDATVRFGGLGMRTEIVAEGKMTQKLLGICRAHVQMMGIQMRLIRISECLTPTNAKVSLVDIPDHRKRPHNVTKYRGIVNHNVNINARLGGKAENSGAPYVLDPLGKPEAMFALLPGEKVKAVYEYCNLHGLWKLDIK